MLLLRFTQNVLKKSSPKLLPWLVDSQVKTWNPSRISLKMRPKKLEMTMKPTLQRRKKSKRRRRYGFPLISYISSCYSTFKSLLEVIHPIFTLNHWTMPKQRFITFLETCSSFRALTICDCLYFPYLHPHTTVERV